MKKYLPALLAAILSGTLINSTYAADTGDVDDVTMDVIDHSDPHAVTNDIQLPDQANQVAKDHVAGTVDDSEHAQNANDSHDNATEEANEDSHASAEEDAHTDAQDAATEDAHEDSQAAAEEQAHQAMQDATDASSSKGD